MIRRQDVAVAVVAVLLVLAAIIALALRSSGSSSTGIGASPADTASPTDTPSPSRTSPAPSPSPTMGPDQALALLGDVDAAAAAEPADVLRAGLVAGRGPWRDLLSPAWPMRAERPVYVGRGRLEDSRVTADLVIVHRLEEDTGEIVLRLLAAAVDGNSLEVTASVEGTEVRARPDPGGLLRVDLGRARDAGDPVTLRLELSYDLTGTATVDRSGPAAYGILGRSPGVAALGHWLPVLTFEPEPLVPWGDVGSFPPAVWSVEIEHGGTLATGGQESPCPGVEAEGCTWSRGLALRDLSAVVVDDARAVETVAAGVSVRALGATDISRESLELAADETETSAEGFVRRFGPLPWRQFDVVAVPLGQGAAGMEFPGLVMVDDELYSALSGGFGTYVLVHEVAHQWFHALVGNGSFADPVVDEPLAQYLSVLAYRDLFGPAAAERLVDETMASRYRRFRQGTLAEEPPAQPSSDFAGPGTYGPLIYARAPLAWLAAEDALGSEAVVSFVAGLVERYGLGVLSAEDLLEDAAAASPELARILERYWYDPDPVPVP